MNSIGVFRPSCKSAIILLLLVLVALHWIYPLLVFIGKWTPLLSNNVKIEKNPKLNPNRKDLNISIFFLAALVIN